MTKKTGLGVTLIASVLVACAPALAAPNHPQVHCLLQTHVTFSHHISLLRSSGRFRGDHGQLTCTGTLAGVKISSIAPARVRGTYGVPSRSPMFAGGGQDTCASGVSSARLTSMLPRVGNFQPEAVRIAGRIDARRTGLDYLSSGQGTAQGRGPMTRWTTSGIGYLVPDGDQDCALVPLASGVLTLQLTLTES